MNNETLFGRIAAISAILSGPVALASFYVVSLAVAFDFEIMSDTAALVSLGADAAEVFRWGELLGTFGFYLLLVPAALFLWRRLRPPSASLMTCIPCWVWPTCSSAQWARRCAPASCLR